jgi:demethylmenaquinone methyltransferase/2-methoxy-6-polyprenyl-1,4-benzoquinol methylase
VSKKLFAQDVFSRIAPRYETMNQFMTFGQVNRYRREVIRLARLQPGDVLLDLGAGPGFLAHLANEMQPQCRIVAADLNLPMMRVGMEQFRDQWSWSAADALHLPFPDASFDAFVCGFLLRNVIDLPAALREIYRILKPGGRIAMLDTTQPPDNILRPAIDFFMHNIIPVAGGIITGQGKGYKYLINTTENFLKPEDLAEQMRLCGFSQVGCRRRLMKMLAVHWGVKENA